MARFGWKRHPPLLGGMGPDSHHGGGYRHKDVGRDLHHYPLWAKGQDELQN
jgi:hypothetical protein